ncbi:hypothetical protein, partial [Candidatus Deferrimicrobium sp.]|uniref:hypothetical protein n=1 Tax=Candidatus Deferrimicrobium sp. TaxID=3060586 RepID=UPI0027198960
LEDPPETLLVVLGQLPDRLEVHRLPFSPLVQRLANTLAFERRCIRSSFVALVRRTLPVRLHYRALLARRIDALDAQVICETLHQRVTGVRGT